MAEGITKERMLHAIKTLPEDATVEDAIERLVFLAKIKRGLAELDDGQGIEHTAVQATLVREGHALVSVFPDTAGKLPEDIVDRVREEIEAERFGME